MREEERRIELLAEEDTFWLHQRRQADRAVRDEPTLGCGGSTVPEQSYVQQCKHCSGRLRAVRCHAPALSSPKQVPEKRSGGDGVEVRLDHLTCRVLAFRDDSSQRSSCASASTRILGTRLYSRDPRACRRGAEQAARDSTARACRSCPHPYAMHAAGQVKLAGSSAPSSTRPRDTLPTRRSALSVD